MMEDKQTATESSSDDVSTTTTTDVKDTSKKTTKPIMEKKRRARFNSSVAQLKVLLVDTIKSEGTRYNKMDKADVLEMAVRHLRRVQGQTSRGSTQHEVPTKVSRFRLGFSECINEVNDFLNELDPETTEVRASVMEYLANCASEYIPERTELVKPHDREIRSTGCDSGLNEILTEEKFNKVKCSLEGSNTDNTNMTFNSTGTYLTSTDSISPCPTQGRQMNFPRQNNTPTDGNSSKCLSTDHSRINSSSFSQHVPIISNQLQKETTHKLTSNISVLGPITPQCSNAGEQNMPPLTSPFSCKQNVQVPVLSSNVNHIQPTQLCSVQLTQLSNGGFAFIVPVGVIQTCPQTDFTSVPPSGNANQLYTNTDTPKDNPLEGTYNTIKTAPSQTLSRSESCAERISFQSKTSVEESIPSASPPFCSSKLSPKLKSPDRYYSVPYRPEVISPMQLKQFNDECRTFQCTQPTFAPNKQVFRKRGQTPDIPTNSTDKANIRVENRLSHNIPAVISNLNTYTPNDIEKVTSNEVQDETYFQFDKFRMPNDVEEPILPIDLTNNRTRIHANNKLATERDVSSNKILESHVSRDQCTDVSSYKILESHVSRDQCTDVSSNKTLEARVSRDQRTDELARGDVNDQGTNNVWRPWSLLNL